MHTFYGPVTGLRRASTFAARSAILLAAGLAAASIAGCRRVEQKVSVAGVFPEEIAAGASRGGFSLDPGKGPILVSIERNASGEVWLDSVKPSELEPAARRVPWPLAPAPSFLSAESGRIYVAINRGGVLILEGAGAKGARWTFVRDPAAFGSRSVVSAWCRQGRYYVFLARSTAFEEGAADPLMVSVAPDETRFRAERAVDPAAIRAGEELIYFSPVGPDTALAQLSKTEGDKTSIAYLRVALADGKAERISKAAYLAGFGFGRADDLGPGLKELCDPALAKARYPKGGSDAFVFVWSGSSSRVEEKAYALSGSQDAELSVSLSAWEDGSSRAVLYPDGRLVLSEKGNAVVESPLPALPYAFDYDKIAMAGGTVAASWSESVYPDTGRSGLAIARFYLGD